MKSSTQHQIVSVLEKLKAQPRKPKIGTQYLTIEDAFTQISQALKADQEYNGYTNYETWLMSLNLDNDQYLNERLMEIANGCGEVYDKAQELKEFVESEFYVEQYGIYKISDIWTERDLQEVDWTEIIECHIDADFESEEDAEDELSEDTLQTIKEINGDA